MNLFQEIRQRRVPQITGGYVAAGWAAVQFLEFLEGRMTVSPNLVNLVVLSLLLLLPAVVTLAWVQGRPGRDTWGRIPKVVVPANVLAIVLLLVFLFQGRELGAVTRTIEVEDENGTVSERVVPKQEFCRRVLFNYPENLGDSEDDWARETIAFLISLDASQDDFVGLTVPMTMAEAATEDGHGLDRARQRKIARDSNHANFVSGTLVRRDSLWTLTTELNAVASGRSTASRSFQSQSLLDLADLASRQLREDLGIPSAHIEESQDLPISELTSTDIDAVREHVSGLVLALHHNDWVGAVAPLEAAVARDSGFALAQFLLYVLYQTSGQMEKASGAINTAMKNLYKLPERTQFLIKSQYYFNEEQDSDKAVAILDMWSRIYPNDVDVYSQKAMFYMVRQDLPRTIAAYEKILEIDPSQVQHMEPLADLYTQLGEYDQAEGYLQRYVDLFPTRVVGYKNLADFYTRVGRLQEARASLEEAQLLEPDQTRLALGLIDLDIKVGLFEESRQALADKLNTVKSTRSRAQIFRRQYELALLTGQGDDLVAAIDSFYAANMKIQNPLQVKIVYAMALPIVSSVGRSEEALQRLHDLSKEIAPPFDQMTGVGKAWVLADLGRLDEARTALAGAVEIANTFKFETLRSSLALVAGLIAEADGDSESALGSYQKALDTAIRVEPQNFIRLARAQRLEGQSSEAEATLRAALKLDPARPEAHLEMVWVLRSQGHDDRAREHLEKAQAAWVNADSGFPLAQEARELADLLR